MGVGTAFSEPLSVSRRALGLRPATSYLLENTPNVGPSSLSPEVQYTHPRAPPRLSACCPPAACVLRGTRSHGKMTKWGLWSQLRPCVTRQVSSSLQIKGGARDVLQSPPHTPSPICLSPLLIFTGQKGEEPAQRGVWGHVQDGPAVNTLQPGWRPAHRGLGLESQAFPGHPVCGAGSGSFSAPCLVSRPPCAWDADAS